MIMQKVWAYNHHTKRVQCDFVEKGQRVKRFHPREKDVFTFAATDALFEFEWLAATLSRTSRGACLDYFKKVKP